MSNDYGPFFYLPVSLHRLTAIMVLAIYLVLLDYLVLYDEKFVGKTEGFLREAANTPCSSFAAIFTVNIK